MMFLQFLKGFCKHDICDPLYATFQFFILEWFFIGEAMGLEIPIFGQ